MRSLKFLCAALAAACLAAPCGAGEAKKTVLQLGHAKGVTTPINQACEYISKRAAELSDGTLEIQIFPAGQLGFERDLIEGMTQGIIDMAWSSSALVGNFEEPMQLFSLPYVFRDYDHVHKVLEGEIGQKIFQDLLDNWELRIIAFHDQGFRHLWNNQKPIASLADMKGIKLRGPESPIYLDTFRLLGVNITPISWGETYTAIQTGVVVGLEQPMEEIVMSRYYEICKYGSFSYHMFAGGPLMIREDLFQSLSPEHRKILLQAAKESEEINNSAVVQLEKDFVAELKKQGMQLNDISREELNKFAAAMAPLYEKYAGSLGGPGIIEQVRAVQ